MDSLPSRDDHQIYKMTLRHQIKFLYQRRFRRIIAALTLLVFSSATESVLSPATSAAQSTNVIYGLGVGAMANTDDGLGFGLRGRVSTPVNADLSFAGDFGVTGFFLEGRQGASIAFDPQVSAIVTIPGENVAMYFLAGFGGYLSTGGDGGELSGPTLHVGIGGAKPLNEGTFFYELNPTIVIKRNSLGLSLPLRIGVIL